jgi:3-hydroxyisobutyrate dehydrogenase-like beta-hydroxyacid dehydrogenase
MNPRPIQRIAIIGFGEAGSIFGADFAAQGLDVRITDILLRQSESRERMFEKARKAKVTAHIAPQDAIVDADLVISAVTSSASTDAAREAARFLGGGQVYLDINSVSPDKKREIACVIETSHAQFVEAAVMAPVPPQRLKVPTLLGGTHAPETAERLRSIGMKATPVSDRIGVASAIKMCRSVLVKGLEALAVECLFAARRYGAEQEVLASLASSYPEMGWTNHLPNYLVGRVAEHGRRRAAEMREVAETLKDVQLDPYMALAAARRQDWLVDQMSKANIPYQDQSFSWTALADGIQAIGKRASPATETSSDPSMTRGNLIGD